MTETEKQAMEDARNRYYPHYKTSDIEERIERDWARDGFAEGWRKCREFMMSEGGNLGESTK